MSVNTENNDINSALLEYKKLIDFSDQTQKNNYKFVESYVKHHTKVLKKNTAHWEQDCHKFVKDAIQLQKDIFLKTRNMNGYN